MKSAFSIRIATRVFAAAALLATAHAAAAASSDEEIQILVKPKQAASEEGIQAALNAHGGRHHKQIRQVNVRVIRAASKNAAKLLKALKERGDVEYAELDAMAHAFGTVNDPYVTSGESWHLSKIQAPAAWDVTTGTSSVVVAVIDTGVAFNHPDLAGKILSGGYDFVSNDNDPSDDNGHGTAVAGVAAAASNNSLGVAGITWGNPVLPIKVLDASGSGSHSAIASGIVYAADHGARILNLSLGGTTGSQTLQDAVNYAWNKGCVIIAAAGNNGNTVPCYPAAYARAVAVSATTSSDTRASWSSYGSHVDVAAPGESILSTSLPNTYSSWNGTSFASPVTAGVAALMVSANPQLSNTQVVDLLIKNSDDIGAAGFDTEFGNGRVNALRAVLAARSFASVDTVLPTVSFSSPSSGATVSGTVNVQVGATDNTGVSRIELYIDGQLEAQSASALASFAWDTLADAEGSHTLEARAYDAAGNVGKSTLTVNVRNSTADTVLPVTSILTPTNNSRISSYTTRVSVSSSDNVGVTKVVLYLDGSAAASSTSPNPTFTWNTTYTARGWHSLQSFAYDAAGNVGGSSVVWVYR